MCVCVCIERSDCIQVYGSTIEDDDVKRSDYKSLNVVQCTTRGINMYGSDTLSKGVRLLAVLSGTNSI